MQNAEDDRRRRANKRRVNEEKEENKGKLEKNYSSSPEVRVNDARTPRSDFNVVVVARFLHRPFQPLPFSFFNTLVSYDSLL